MYGNTEDSSTYIVKDKKYTTPNIPITTRRFGPSGSLKNENIALDNMRAVIPKIINEVLFDLKYMILIIH